MKKIFTLLLISFSFLTFSQEQENYSRAKILLDSEKQTLTKLSSLGLAVDHGEHKKNSYFISDFSEHEITKARNNGYTVEILIEDVSAYYANQNNTNIPPVKKKGSVLENENNRNTDCFAQNPITTPTGFQYGSMGGYFTYNEMLTVLDDMTSQYPNLITAKQPIGTFTSIEGRPIYWLKISDNPSTDESEPEILYTALHHAREAASLSQMIYYMYYLLEHYGNDPEITALINNTEMYFVPCVNPDGYIYNENTNPNGGGMWRKNRRNNNNGSYGIDLNRNYGFHWGLDDIGSSPDPNDQTYRGTSAFSEPETQAIKWFAENHQFKMTLNYHSYGNDLIYPWGYIADLYTPDSAVFVNHTHLMTSYNHYVSGTGNQTVGYVTNGDSDDWGYGEQTTKNKILSMTPEIGDYNDGFWPPISNIIPICENSLWQNIFGAELIGKYAQTKDLEASYMEQQSGFFNYSVQRLGLDSPAVYTVSVVPVDNWITSVGSPKTYSTMSLLETKTDSISYTLSNAISTGQTFRYVLRVNNGLYDKNDTITKIYGQAGVAYSNTASSLSEFTSGGGNWGISTTEYVSAPSSITDSPNGNYSNNLNKRLTLNTPINLSTAISATLTFWAKWEIEAGYDYVELLASDDGGSSWTPLCGKYTKPGNVNQTSGTPIYEGDQTTWVKEEINLDDYLGASILLRFRLVSDGGLTKDGFYFDELSVKTITPTVGTSELLNNDKNVVLQNIPNPAQNSTAIHFSIKNVKNPKLVVYTVLGKQVHEESIRENQTATTIDLSTFANGTYFYSISGENYTSPAHKIIVLK